MGFADQHVSADLKVRPLTPPAPGAGVAAAVRPLIARFLGERLPLRFEFWDGSAIEPATGDGTPGAVVRIHSVDAVRRILWAPGEIGLARAFVAGEIEIDGDIFCRPPGPERGVGQGPDASRARCPSGRREGAHRVGALRFAPPPPAEEARPRGRRHSRGRDAQAVSHHYDVGNDFYELVLGSEHDLLLCPLRRPRHHPGGSPVGQARTDLPQARPPREAGGPAPRRRLRMGVDGPACRRLSRRQRGGRDLERGPGRVRPTPGGRRRPVGP